MAKQSAQQHTLLAYASSHHFLLALLGLLLSLPFLVPFHVNPIPSFYSEWLAIALGLLAIGACVLRSSTWHLPSLIFAPLGLALIVALQWLLGMFAYTANVFIILIYLLWATMLLAVGQTIANQLGVQRVFTCLAWFVLLGSSLNAVAGLLQYAEWQAGFGAWIAAPMPLAEYGVYGNLAQQNHFVTHLALGLASAAYLRWRLALGKLPFFFLCALLLLALILSASRSSFLFIAWLLVLAFGRQHWTAGAAGAGQRSAPFSIAKRYVVAGVIVVIILTAALLAGAAHFGQLGPQVSRLFTFSGAIGVRGFLWQNALQMFFDHPLLGVGFDSFAYHLVAQFQQPNPWGIDQHAHNLIFQLLAVTGLAGSLAVGVPILLFIRRQWRAEFSVERLACWAVLGILFIHSMLEQPLYFGYFLALAALFAGMLDKQVCTLSISRLVRYSSVLLVCAGLVVALKTLQDFQRLVVVAYSGHDFSSASPESQIARQEILRDLQQHSLFAALSELAAPEVFVAADAPALEKIALNQRVLRFAPVAETAYRQAALLAEAGQQLEVKQQFARAALAYPQELKSYLLRFDALAQAQPQTYGELAAYAHQFTRAHHF